MYCFDRVVIAALCRFFACDRRQIILEKSRPDKLIMLVHRGGADMTASVVRPCGLRRTFCWTQRCWPWSPAPTAVFSPARCVGALHRGGLFAADHRACPALAHPAGSAAAALPRFRRLSRRRRRASLGRRGLPAALRRGAASAGSARCCRRGASGRLHCCADGCPRRCLQLH